MRKLIMSALLAAGLGALGACGSSSSDTNTSTATDTTTSINTGTAVTPTPGAFAGSCNVTTSSTAGGMTITVTVCTDFNGESASAVQSGCTSASGGTITATYSPDHCPTANLLGKCTLPNADVNYYYSGGSDTKTSDQKACTNSRGIWSDT